MKTYTIYSKRLRSLLIDNGFIEIKRPERNIHNPRYYVFFFLDSEELRRFIAHYKGDKDDE